MHNTMLTLLIIPVRTFEKIPLLALIIQAEIEYPLLA